MPTNKEGQVPEEAVEAAGRQAFRSDNGGSDAPLGADELRVMREALQAAYPAILADLRERLLDPAATQMLASFQDADLVQGFLEAALEPEEKKR
jgi:hypothetical protein